MHFLSESMAEEEAGVGVEAEVEVEAADVEVDPEEEAVEEDGVEEEVVSEVEEKAAVGVEEEAVSEVEEKSIAMTTAEDVEVADAGGWAPAIHNCPHLAHGIGPCSDDTFPWIRTAEEWECSVDGCAHTECWVCLSCCEVFCGRYGSRHMVEHHAAHSSHCVALGIGDLSFWCFSCDSYLHHLSIRPIFEVYEIAHRKKFAEEVPAHLAAQASFHEHDTFMSYMDTVEEEEEWEEGDEDMRMCPFPTHSLTHICVSGVDDSIVTGGDDGDKEEKKEEEEPATTTTEEDVFRDPSLNPLTADGKRAVRTAGSTSGASTALSADECKELFDSAAELAKKARVVAMCIRGSRHSVVHTGAGISTAAKIPDYRGPKGVWTLRAKGEKVKMEITLEQAVPTYSHMALKQMVDRR